MRRQISLELHKTILLPFPEQKGRGSAGGEVFPGGEGGWNSGTSSLREKPSPPSAKPLPLQTGAEETFLPKREKRLRFSAQTKIHSGRRGERKYKIDMPLL